MKSIRTLLFLCLIPAFLTVIVYNRCDRRVEEEDNPSSISGEYFPIAEGVSGLGGDLDDHLHFVIIPTIAGRVPLTYQGFGGAGYEWRGAILFQNEKRLSWTVKCDRPREVCTAVIGKQTFDLNEGQIFFVSHLGTKQISGSVAGQKHDPNNNKRLMALYRQETGSPEEEPPPSSAPPLNRP